MKKTILLSLCTVALSAGTMTIISSGKVDVNELPQKGISVMSLEKKSTKPEYKEVKIKDGNVERTIYVEVIKKEKPKLDKLNSHLGLIMKFNKNIELDDFTARFGLKFKTKLESINYYIFENKSAFTDVELISKILETEVNKDISTIRANWPMDMVPN